MLKFILVTCIQELVPLLDESNRIVFGISDKNNKMALEHAGELDDYITNLELVND